MEWPSFASTRTNWPTWAGWSLDSLLKDFYFTDSGTVRVASQSFKVIQVLGYKGTVNGDDRVVVNINNVESVCLPNFLKLVPQEAGDFPLWGLNIILSFRKKEEIEEYFAKPGEEFDYPSADTLRGFCFQRTTFDELQLSETFLRMIHSNRRVPLFARSDGKLWTSLGSHIVYHICTEDQLPKDLALTLSANLNSGLTSAFLHGCSKGLGKLLVDWIAKTKHCASHPLLLLACVAEIEFRRHRNVQREYQDKFSQSYDDIHQLALRLGQYHDESSADARKRQFHYIGDFIGRVFLMYEKAGRLHTQIISFQKLLKVIMESLDRIHDATQANTRPGLDFAGQLITERMEALYMEYENLVQQSTITMDGTSLLLTSIWSLIGQKDNQLNQDIANSSRVVAMESKRDSSSMKALAVLTMFFLPATATAAVFALPVFDWNAHPSWPGVNSGFWVYWVVTIPLTIIVLYIWRYWFIGADQHQRREDAKVVGEEYMEMSKLHRILLQNHDKAKTYLGAASA